MDTVQNVGTIHTSGIWYHEETRYGAVTVSRRHTAEQHFIRIMKS